MRRLLLEMLEEVGITTVYVTHDQEEAFEISDETLVLNGGREAQQGTPQELYNDPRTPFVANFLGEANLFSASVVETDRANGRARCEISEGSTTVEMVCTYTDESVLSNPTAVVRPEDVYPEAQTDGSTVRQETNRWSGTVAHQFYRGSFTQNMVNVGDVRFMIKTDAPILEEGEDVTVVVDPGDASLVSTE